MPQATEGCSAVRNGFSLFLVGPLVRSVSVLLKSVVPFETDTQSKGKGVRK